MSMPTTQPEPLARRLSVWGLWLLVINGIIGAGIFGIPARAEGLVGAFSPWLFVLCGLMIAPIMLSFAQLSSAFSGTGGPILYTRTAFGPFAGFQIGWAFYIARMTAFAANLNLLVTTVEYLSALLTGDAFGPIIRVGLLFGICAAFVWINIAGARAAMRSLGVLTVLKLVPLVALAGYGLVRLDAQVFTAAASPPALPDLGTALLLVIYAYVGFESGLVPAGEAKNPQRDMPRALILALAVAAGAYVLIQVATQRLVPDLADSERPIVDAGRALLGEGGAIAVVLVIIASVGGNLLGSMFSASRLTYRLGLDGQLPRLFAAIHPTHGTPWFSVLVYGGAAFALAATGSFVWLAVLSVFTRLLLYMACIAAMPRVHAMALSEPEPEPQAAPESGAGSKPAAPDETGSDREDASLSDTGMIRLPGGWTIPVIAMLVCVALLTRVSWQSVAATAGLLAVGTVLFLIAARRRQEPGAMPNNPGD